MSILGDLFGSLMGNDTVEFSPPCSICPGNCPIGPAACEECQPYKEQLMEALYNVEHLEEFKARYVVVSSVSTGTTQCPYCGGPSSNRFVCDYCGMQLAEDDGKIRVTSASAIPDPIIVARDIIYDRQKEIVSKYNKSTESGSLLAVLFGLADSASSNLGQRMGKEEITEAANLYGVSVASYLAGLDNGIYKSLSDKKKEDAAAAAASAASTITIGGTTGYGQGHTSIPRPPQFPMPSMQGSMQDRPDVFGSGHKPGQGGFGPGQGSHGGQGGFRPGQGSHGGQSGFRPTQITPRPSQSGQKPGQSSQKPAQKPSQSAQKPAQKPGQSSAKPEQGAKKPYSGKKGIGKK